MSSSTSGASTRESIATPGPSRQSASTAQGADTPIERPRMNPRESINDPDGTILSPPIMKQVGRHTVLLDAKTFQVNANKLNVINHAAATAFFQEVIRHENMLDELDKELSNGCQKRLTYRTSNWHIEIGGIRIRGYRLF
jgi:hypothetical protein